MHVKCEVEYLIKCKDDKFRSTESFENATHVQLHLFSVKPTIVKDKYDGDVIGFENGICVETITKSAMFEAVPSTGRIIYLHFYDYSWAYDYGRDAVYILNTVINI